MQIFNYIKLCPKENNTYNPDFGRKKQAELNDLVGDLNLIKTQAE